MPHSWILAQSDGGSTLPSGVGETVIWVAVAAVIVGLYLFVRRTRRRTMQHYLDRQQREDELRRNDPDMRQDPDG